MSYDDLKHHRGRAYTGMRVGRSHAWRYPNGRWTERKEAPDRWRVQFESIKQRQDPAPVGSGVPPGSQYHWFILAHQRARKLDKDAYATSLQGLKYKVGHRRPNWSQWSYDLAGRQSERERLIEVLEDALARLKAQDPSLDPPVQTTLF